MNYVPYTYLIGWPHLNKWYYGVRYAKNCNPDDFWVSYFTSSKKVLEFINQFGDPTHKEIRKMFVNKTNAQLWESKVLKRIKAVKSENWLNRNDRLAPPINPLGNISMRKPELREKARKNNTGEKNPMFGKKQEQKICPHCNKIVGANVYARWHNDNCPIFNPTAFRPVGNKNPFYGKKHRNIEQKTCIYCNKTLDIRNYSKYHGDKCKFSSTRTVTC